MFQSIAVIILIMLKLFEVFFFLFFRGLVEFPCETNWAWCSFVGKLFNHFLYFFYGNWSVKTVSTGINLSKSYFSRKLSISSRFSNNFAQNWEKNNLLCFYFRFLCFGDFSYPAAATVSQVVCLCFLPFIFLISLAGGLYILLIVSALSLFINLLFFYFLIHQLFFFIDSFFLDSFGLLSSFLAF